MPGRRRRALLECGHNMTKTSLRLTAELSRSPLDARRGVVRLHPTVMHALGMRPWDPVVVRGSRPTGGLAALAPPDTDPGTVLLDHLTCTNARASFGDEVVVGPAAVRPAEMISIAGGPDESMDPALLRMALLGKVLFKGDRTSLLPQDFTGRGEGQGSMHDVLTGLAATFGTSWQTIEFEIGDTHPAGLVSVTMETVVAFAGSQTQSSATPWADHGPPRTSDLPGLEEQARSLRELLELGFSRRELLKRLGGSPRLGVLITGPPGSGKSALVEAICAALKLRLVRLWGPAITRLEPNAGAREIDSVLGQATQGPPTVVLIEDVEAIVPATDAGPLASVLLENINESLADESASVIATSSHPERLAPELLRPGLLEHEIEIPLPRRQQRRAILDIHTRRMPLAPDVSLDKVAARTPGFVVADLLALCREASLRAAQRFSDESSTRSATPAVSADDFEAALQAVRPSALEGGAVDVAHIRLDEVGDMEETKKQLEEAVIWPLRYPDTFQRLGVEPPSGVLLYGPPGCGKTFLVKALAHAGESSFLAIKGAELLSKWVGESERGVRELFRRARSAAPTLIFFDEIDALTPARGQNSDGGTTDRIVAQLLTELDGIEDLKDVFVVGATNRPDIVDPALLRPGRLERLVYVPPPDEEARVAILAAACRKMPLDDDIDLGSIAETCHGYSAADLDALARTAAMVAMRDDMKSLVVNNDHFERAREEIRPSLRSQDIAELERFAAGRR
jgi:transitional endoplasmic reticulum ATPase